MSHNGRITILRDSASGMAARTLEEELFESGRETFCHGEITPELADQLILQMRYLARQDADAPITMHINSNGGSVAAGLAIYDAMQALPCPVNTVCTSLAASMAALLFAAGKRRSIYPHAEVMVHDPLIRGGASGSALEVEKAGRRIMDTRQEAAAILARHTGHTKQEILKRTRTDTYFGAEEAVAFGLADAVITRMEGGGGHAA